MGFVVRSSFRFSRNQEWVKTVPEKKYLGGSVVIRNSKGAIFWLKR